MQTHSNLTLNDGVYRIPTGGVTRKGARTVAPTETEMAPERTPANASNRA